MRLLLVALALVMTLLYFTFGLRVGYVTLMPTYLFNATGVNRYSYEIYDEEQKVGIGGSCKVSSGQAVFRLLDASGSQVAGQACPKGTKVNFSSGWRSGALVDAYLYEFDV